MGEVMNTELRMAEMSDMEWITEDIETVVEGWFADQRISTHDFLDRLETFTMRRDVFLGSDTTAPIVKHILSIARKVKKELTE